MVSKINKKTSGDFIDRLISKPGNSLLGKISGGKWSFRGFCGGAFRFWACMIFTAPLLMKPIISLERKIFGKTTAVKKEEAEELARKAGKSQETPPIIYPDYTQQNGQTSSFQSVKPASTMQPLQQNNKLTYSQEPQSQRNMVPTEDKKRRYIPSDENVIANSQNNLLNIYKTQPTAPKEMIPVEQPKRRGYMPSSDGVKVVVSDKQDEKVVKAMQKSAIAEKWANKYVKADEK